MIHILLPTLPDDLVVRGDAAHHLASVLRVRRGETLELLDGAGHTLPVTVQETSKHEVHCTALGPLQTHPRPTPSFTLFQCIAKSTHMEWLVEKAVELGAETLVPVLSRNCVSRPDVGSTVSRWERIAAAALGQCGSPWQMAITPVHSWAQALERVRAFDGTVITAALPEGTPQLRDVLASLSPSPSRYGLFVGPEGDFTDFELDDLRAAGSRFAGLGPTVLRTDTATTAALACLRLLG